MSVTHDERPRAGAPPAFAATVSEDGDTVTVTLSGELDLAWAEEVVQAFAQARASAAPRVRVDLGPLRFIDSTGIKELVVLHQKLVRAGRPLTMAPGGSAVQRVLALSGLLDVLPFEP